MRKCKRNVLLIFGYLLIIAILFIPYAYIQTRFEYSDTLNSDMPVFTRKDGFMFLPLYLKAKANRFYSEDLGWDTYRFDLDMFLTEVAIICLTGGFSYIIFCVVLRKREAEK